MAVTRKWLILVKFDEIFKKKLGSNVKHTDIMVN